MARGWLRGVLLLVAGAAGGYLAGHQGSLAPVPAAGAERREPVVLHWSGDAAAPAADSAGRAATLAAVLRIRGDFSQTAALYALVESAGVDDLQRLIGEGDSVPGSNDRRAALSIIYSRYAELDPAGAVDYLQRRGGSYDDVELRSIFHVWSRTDLTAAVASAATLPVPMRKSAGLSILTSRDDLPADAANDIAGRLAVEGLLAQITLQRSLDEADRDPVAAWQTALAAPENPMRYQRLATVAGGWARDDPLAAMAAVSALGNRAARTQLQAQVLYQWGQRDPQQAVDWALAQPASPQRRRLTTQALTAMAADEPGLAFDIAQGLDGEERTEAINNVLSRWAGEDPAAAADAVESVAGLAARRNAIANIASAYARQDPEAALQWATGLNGDEGEGAVVMTFAVLARQDPQRAGDLVGRLPAASSRDGAATAVVQAWVQKDPQAAAHWVDDLSDEAMRARVSGTLAASWSQVDRAAALGYVESIPGAAERDAALMAVIGAQYNDLDFAEGLFARLTQPEQRVAAARQLYALMHDRDPDRAEHYRELAGVVAPLPAQR